jgi:hypothetical protein
MEQILRTKLEKLLKTGSFQKNIKKDRCYVRKIFLSPPPRQQFCEKFLYVGKFFEISPPPQIKNVPPPLPLSADSEG